MKKQFAALTAFIFAISFMLTLLLTAVNLFAANEKFYMNEYKKLDRMSAIGISVDDLESVTDVLLSYTRGERQDITVEANILGEKREAFNEKEKAHMVDVKNLYLGARTVNLISFIIVILIILGLIIARNLKFTAAFLSRVKSMWLWLIVAFLAIGAYIALDFDSFWTVFHKLFFENELWQLNATTDILIQMMPGELFFDMVTLILIAFMVSYALCFFVIHFILKSLSKKGYLKWI